MKTEGMIAEEFPLHYHIWKDDPCALQSCLDQHIQQLERLDPRGRTPLMLAVTLERSECAALLLEKGANVEVENAGGWTAVQEAVATGKSRLIRQVLTKRDLQRHTTRMVGIPALLHKLKEAPDFYMEMKWEFTSWVPLVSRMCPSDVYKVYKRGSCVRIDTTLLGFDQSSWQRGNRSYLFKAESEDKAVLMEVDHEAGQVFVEELRTVPEGGAARHLVPSEESIRARLGSPIVRTYLDTDKICFERNKSGLWGWRSDKVETVNGRDCKVFGATNVELVTKSRTEHLGEEDKRRLLANQNGSRFPLNSLLAAVQVEEPASDHPADGEEGGQENPVTMEEYFDPNLDLGKRDIGRRPKEVSTKIQKFKATLWLCEDYPLSLADQIMPVVDLMAISSTHFAKLRDFIQMQLPAGFPVKIEIPLFHVMNACITFGNTFGLDEPVPGVTSLQEADGRLSCVVDDSCFEAPPGYAVFGGSAGGMSRSGGGPAGDRMHQFSLDEEDELLQYAIQQSLLDVGSESDEVDIWEALKAERPPQQQLPNTPQPSRPHRSPLPPRPSSSLGFRLSPEEELLQRAIEASLLGCAGGDVTMMMSNGVGSPGGAASAEEERERELLAEALAISARETALEEERRSREDEELLRRILELSLMEK